MGTVIFARLDKIDFETTLEQITLVEAIDQLKLEQGTFVVPDDSAALVVPLRGSTLIFPASARDQANDGDRIYFDLEQYPFFQKVKESITDVKGVLRFRRTAFAGQTEGIIASDLFIFASIFGVPVDVQVKRTKPGVTPTHIILTAKFPGGAMGHLEYTFSDSERIELEWSGIKQIIEFDSEEMTPLEPKSFTSLPLTYPVDTILTTAHMVNQELRNQLETYEQLVTGGVQQ